MKRDIHKETRGGQRGASILERIEKDVGSGGFGEGEEMDEKRKRRREV